MADLEGDFVPSEHKSNSFGEPIPAGKYTAMIVDSEKKNTKTGTGAYIKLTFEIMDGAHKGRKLFSNLNLWNANKQAEEIARGDLKSICEAVGLPKICDSAQLHNLPLQINVKTKMYEGSPQNEIKGYSARGASAPVSEPQTKAPWERK